MLRAFPTSESSGLPNTAKLSSTALLLLSSLLTPLAGSVGSFCIHALQQGLGCSARQETEAEQRIAKGSGAQVRTIGETALNRYKCLHREILEWLNLPTNWAGDFTPFCRCRSSTVCCNPQRGKASQTAPVHFDIFAEQRSKTA